MKKGERNAVVLVSDSVVIILIQWHYMCDFPVNLLPNFLKKEKQLVLFEIHGTSIKYQYPIRAQPNIFLNVIATTVFIK